MRATGGGLDPELARLVADTRETAFSAGFDDRVMDRIAAERAIDPLVRTRPMALILSLPAPVRRVAVAAAVVVLVVAAGVVMDAYRWRTVDAPSGSVLTHRLPDGSEISLHPGTTLRYRPFRGRGERRIHLEGEAFLDVAHAGKPFVVETFNADVVVTGTRFNVRAWPDASTAETAVALVEGSVVVRARTEAPILAITDSGTGEVRLAAGETARVTTDGTALRVAEAPRPADAANWTRGGLSFSNRPLADVLRTLERRYDVRIRADASVTEGRTATYLNPETPALPDVLDALSFALGLRYGRTADGWVLTVPDTTDSPTR